MSRITSRTSDGGYTVASSAYRPNDAPSQSSGSVSRRADGGNLEEARRIARTHWKELRSFLIQQGDGKDLANRTNARDKLTRLTRQQFQELSTDVYDELVRRTTDPAIAEPFLPLKNEFHPKRNQARQKLATLPPGRFKDLGNDVYTELDRRYPEFEEEEKQMERERMEREQQQYNGYNNDPQSPASMYPPPDSRPPYRENRDNTLTRRPAPLQVAPSAASEVLVPNKSVLVEDDGPSLPGNDEMSPQSYTASPPRYNNPLPNGLSTKNSRNLDSPDTKSKAESDYFDKLSIGRGSEASSVGGRFLGNFAAEKADDRVSKEEMEKMKSDYEFKLATLQRRFEGAEKDLEREREERRRDAEDKLNLETELRSEQQRFDDQSVSLQSLQRDLNNAQTRLAETQSQLAKARTMERDDGSISRMKRDLDAAEREKEDLRRGVEELRGEIKSLLSELRKMGEKYEELSKDRERDEEELEGVKAQLNMYKKKFEQAKTELRNIKATSQFFMNTNTPSISSDNLPASDSGGIADIHITTFQSNIDDLLSSGRSQSPSSVLGAMKNIVQTVSKIDADIVSFEATPSYRSFSPDDRDRLQNLKAKSSATLTNLMVAAKSHATSFGISPVSLLDAAASHLATTIVDMAKLVQVRRASPQEIEEANTATSRNTITPPATSRIERLRQDEPAYTQRSPPSGSQSLASLRSRQNTLDSKSSIDSTDRFGTMRSEDRYPASRPNGSISGGRNGYTNERSQHRPEPSSSSSSFNYGRRLMDETAPSSDRNGLGRSYSSESERSPPAPRPEPVRGNDEDDRDAGELKTYLENQTENIVSSIQALLSAIRGNAQGSQIDEHLNQIITIVSSIVAITRDRMPSSSRANVDPILSELSEDCDRLTEMQNSSGSQYVKQIKQNIATCCFSIAKNLKQLNAALTTE